MKYDNILIGNLRGKLGGLVGSSNRFGNYLRGKGIITNPNTVGQQEARNAFGQLSADWRLLTAQERQIWKDYADATPVLKNGESVILTAQNMYQRCYTPRLLFLPNAVFPASPPTTPGLPVYAPTTGESNTASIFDLVITIDPNDAWANDDLGFMYVSVSEGQEQSINFFKGPYRRGGLVAGSTAGPAPSTLTIPRRDSWLPGKKIFVRVQVSDAEGRLGQPQEYTVDVEV